MSIIKIIEAVIVVSSNIEKYNSLNGIVLTTFKLISRNLHFKCDSGQISKSQRHAFDFPRPTCTKDELYSQSSIVYNSSKMIPAAETFVYATVVIIINLILTVAAENNNVTLKLVHLIFRHGDRTNDAATTYPTDPYRNETYDPYGLGQLTNKGRRTAFLLGKQLRIKYDNFLDDSYTPNILDAFTTDRDRTKASLQLVLAGLFPPKGTSMEWEKDLNWQPIPYKHLSVPNDHLLSFPHLYCSNYSKVYETYINSSEGKAVEEKYSEIYPYLSENTGLGHMKSTYDIRWLYFGLTTQSEWGFKLPPWTHRVYPDILEKAVIDFYIQSTATPELKQLSGGFLLKKIIYDSQLKLTGQLTPQNRKLFLYSAHESNVAYLLNTIGVYFPHIPPYGACIMIEVHQINEINGIKIFYEDYSEKEPKLLTIPGCDSFCPFDQFTKLMEKNLPSKENICEED